MKKPNVNFYLKVDSCQWGSVIADIKYETGSGLPFLFQRDLEEGGGLHHHIGISS